MSETGRGRYRSPEPGAAACRCSLRELGVGVGACQSPKTGEWGARHRTRGSLPPGIAVQPGAGADPQAVGQRHAARPAVPSDPLGPSLVKDFSYQCGTGTRPIWARRQPNAARISVAGLPRRGVSTPQRRFRASGSRLAVNRACQKAALRVAGQNLGVKAVTARERPRNSGRGGGPGEAGGR